jgi:hypothetical protein
VTAAGAAWDRYLFTPVSAARLWLVRAGTLAMLALDVWITRVGPGWRYGASEFNVAHFGWLDAVAPAPTAARYLGALVLVGLGSAVVAADARAPRALLAAVTVLYTWTWAISMQDGYQHHYLLTWVLAGLVLLPRVTLAELSPPRENATASAWSYAVVAVTCGLVYAYGAVAKLEPEWLGGHVFHRIADASPAASARLLREVAETEALRWRVLSAGVVLAELLLAAAFALAPLRDRTPRIPRVAWIVALGTALAFHLGIQMIGLGIGWFSWYMLLFALAFLSPHRWVTRITQALARLAALARGMAAPRTGVMAALLAAAVLATVGSLLRLPGMLEACLTAAAVLVAAALLSARRGTGPAVAGYARAAALAAVVMALAITLSAARHDFHRFAAGDARRRAAPHAPAQ